VCTISGILQGVFQVAAVLPVNYVIQEMEDIFNPNNDVSFSFGSQTNKLWWAISLDCKGLLDNVLVLRS
jgi:hypothetical protein